jgi:hypothetical protein
MKYIYGCVNVSHPNNSATLDRTIFDLLQNPSTGPVEEPPKVLNLR